jgi:hypothetical protein
MNRKKKRLLYLMFWTLTYLLSRDKDSSINLPIFWGSLLLLCHRRRGGLVLLISHTGREGKDFTWSRGLGSEISPIKTRSARKKIVSIPS